jgi:transposase
MLRVDQYDYIRIAHRIYQKKIREIARETGHSRNTVKKVLQGEYEGYRPRQHQPYPVLGPYRQVIDQWLSQDQDRPRKQRHTAVRVYNRLSQEYGFSGGESTVRRYVREARSLLGIDSGGVYLPLEPQLGLEGEVDWGSCQVIVAGQYTPLHLFCMRSKGSGKAFACCFPCERQPAFFEGHLKAFAFYGGVFRNLIYDNLTTAVDKVLRGKERKLNESFHRFQAYYNFSPRFCNVGQAHEKGGVEGLVGYVRRNFLVPIPEVESLDELNAHLLAECSRYGDHRMAGREQTVNELFELEKEHLLALPELPFSNVDTVSGKVDKYSTIIVDKNRYSVPTSYAGLKVRVLLSVGRVELFYGSQRIAGHERLYGNNKWQLDPRHYLELLLRRPQAFDSARPIRQWRPSWPASLEQLLSRFCESQGPTSGIKDFIRVLLLFKENEEKEVIEAVEAAVRAKVSESGAVEHLLLRSRTTSYEVPPLDHWPRLPTPDLSVYGQIGGER